jgi:hypothetical protein
MINKIKIDETKDCVSVVEWFVEWLNFIVDKNNRMITDSNKNKINWTNDDSNYKNNNYLVLTKPCNIWKRNDLKFTKLST